MHYLDSTMKSISIPTDVSETTHINAKATLTTMSSYTPTRRKTSGNKDRKPLCFSSSDEEDSEDEEKYEAQNIVVPSGPAYASIHSIATNMEVDVLEHVSKVSPASSSARRRSRRKRTSTEKGEIDSDDECFDDDNDEKDFSKVEEEEEFSQDDGDSEEHDSSMLEDSFEVEEQKDDSDNEADESGDEEFIVPDTGNGAWAKEAALYNDDREESDDSGSDLDEYDTDDDEVAEETMEANDNGWQSIQRKTKKKKHKKLNQKRKRKNAPKKRYIRNDVDMIPMLSPNDKRAQLNMIDTRDDEEGVKLVNKFLACVLWDLDFRYTLLTHQYIGVLGVAGVDVKKLGIRLLKMDEAGHDLLFNVEEESGKTARCDICGTLAFTNTRGILLADDMGLGKTVQGLGAAVLRNGITAIQSDLSEKRLRKKMPTGMYAYMYVCMYVYMYVCIYIHEYDYVINKCMK